MLSVLGRGEEALAAAEEAVAIRRELAKSRPDAFLPDLVRSLGLLGSCLRAVARLQDAAEAFREGIQTLEPFLAAFPDAFRGLAAALVTNYLEVSEEVGSEPDLELVKRIMQDIGHETGGRVVGFARIFPSTRCNKLPVPH